MPATKTFLSQSVIYNCQSPAWQHLGRLIKRRTEILQSNGSPVGDSRHCAAGVGGREGRLKLWVSWEYPPAVSSQWWNDCPQPFRKAKFTLLLVLSNQESSLPPGRMHLRPRYFYTQLQRNGIDLKSVIRICQGPKNHSTPLASPVVLSF